MGNESCDLDSAISAVVLAYFYDQNPNLVNSTKITNIVPVLNVNREDLPLKTEVVYHFEKHNIKQDELICKDELDLEQKSIDFILVDHHVSKYHNNVIFAIDHRPLDATSSLPKNADLILKQIGSCSTLITEILQNHKTDTKDYELLLNLLYGPIVLDTVNFSKEADKARELDFRMANYIESNLNIENVTEYRKALLEELVSARSNVDTLDSFQILLKDLKIIKNQTIVVAIPGYPILVKEYVQKKNADDNILKFAQIHNCDIVVCMGMLVANDTVTRDLGIINIKNDKIFDKIIESIVSSKDPDLQLEEYTNIKFLNGKFFQQKNIKASRKQLLPLLNKLIN